MTKYCGFIATIVALTLTFSVQAQSSRPKSKVIEREKISQPASANPVPYKGNTQQETPGEPDSRQSMDAYSGVTIQGGAPPAFKPPPDGLQYITWPGFRSTAEGSEVFLQLTGPVSYQQQIKGRKVFVTLDKVTVPFRNNLRPVITQQFPQSIVSSFRLRMLGRSRAKSHKMRLEISLLEKAKPQITVSNQGQYTYLVIGFPAGHMKQKAEEPKIRVYEDLEPQSVESPIIPE